MAKQTGLIKFTKRVGDLIGYRVGKEYYLRSMPAEVRQSPRTKISARYFGKASMLGAAMRHAAYRLLDMPGEMGLGNRLNRALLGVLWQDDLHHSKTFIPQNFRGLKGFSFNQHTTLDQVLTVIPAVTPDFYGNLHVTIPAMSVYTGNPVATHLRIRAVGVFLQPGFTEAAATASEPVLVDVSRPSSAFTLVVPAQKGALCTVILEVMCCKRENGRMVMLMNRKYSAAEVIAVLTGKKEPKEHSHAAQPEQEAWAGRGALPLVPGLVINFPQRE
ncbi:hypothetical protein [Chitinophaga alhagiae]|uniref:hypothetical protein n=1 Tax=Chitinophaga alhagiae TaxID=2203219 RepID=UPI00130026AA|nr:hypothetical protein [Chitinophaga alhagiae]